MVKVSSCTTFPPSCDSTHQTSLTLIAVLYMPYFFSNVHRFLLFASNNVIRHNLIGQPKAKTLTCEVC